MSYVCLKCNKIRKIQKVSPVLRVLPRQKKEARIVLNELKKIKRSIELVSEDTIETKYVIPAIITLIIGIISFI